MFPSHWDVAGLALQQAAVLAPLAGYPVNEKLGRAGTIPVLKGSLGLS